MANIYGFDSYGTDLYVKKGNLLLPEQLVGRPTTSSATFTEVLEDRFANLSTATNPNVAPLNNVAPEATANPNMIKIVQKHRVGSGRNEKFYIFDENGNKYEVRHKQYNKLKPGNTVNNSQFKKVGTTNIPPVAETPKVLSPEAQLALDNARRAEQGAHFQGTSQEAMNRLHGIGQETDVTKYFRNLETQQTLSPEAQRALDNARRAEQGAHFQGTSQEAMNRLHGIGQEADVTKYFRNLEAQQANTPAENTPAKGKKSRAERLKNIRSNPEARARYNRLKLRNNPELKARYDRMANFKKMKGLKKAGKWGAIAALAIGAGALLLNKCSDDKKAVVPVEPTKPTEPEKPTTPVTPVPVEPEEPTTPTEPETPVTPAPAQETENSAINAVKGDDYWKYAKMELIAEHQGDVDYKPTDAEIYTKMKEIMARTNIGMADDNVHSDPLLMVNDEVQLNEQAAKLRNEAIKQLKEEHKNQDNYEPTYSEVNKKFKELVAKAQAEAAEKAEA